MANEVQTRILAMLEKRCRVEAEVRRAAGRSDGAVAVQQEDVTDCLRDVVRLQHVRVAAEILFNSPVTAPRSQYVTFLSATPTKDLSANKFVNLMRPDSVLPPVEILATVPRRSAAGKVLRSKLPETQH